MSVDKRQPIKSEVSEQLCRVSQFGSKDFNSFSCTSPLADPDGRLWTRNIDPIPTVLDAVQKSSPPGGALVTSAHVFTNVCRIVNVSGYNANTAQLFVMLFDDFGTAPILGDVPKITIPVPGNFTSFSYGAPFIFLHGMGIAISSTQFFYTPVAPASLSYVAICDRGGPTA
jgi:hypothetical protein